MGSKMLKISGLTAGYTYISIYTVYLNHFRVVSAVGENFFGLFSTRVRGRKIYLKSTRGSGRKIYFFTRGGGRKFFRSLGGGHDNTLKYKKIYLLI